MSPRFATLAVLVVLVHLAVNLAHGWAHLTIPVPNTPAQNAFIIPVIGVAPLVAAWLIATRRTLVGAALLTASMFGSLVFGVAYHYVIQSPDHVAHVPASMAGSVFRTSALGLALAELTGFLIGSWGVTRAIGSSAAEPRVSR